MFENIKSAINQHYNNEAEKFASSLETITTEYALNHWYYSNQMTPAARKEAENAVQECNLPKTVKEKMIKRFNRENEKARAKRLEEVATVEEYSLPNYVDITVEWVKNRTWGYNPTATITAGKRRSTDSASGCGYDKQSAAIAGAMNKNPEIMRILYEHAEKGEQFPYSVLMFAGVPHFDGGCGVSCFGPVFKACGYEWRCTGSGKMFDCYTLTKI